MVEVTRPSSVVNTQLVTNTVLSKLTCRTRACGELRLHRQHHRQTSFPAPHVEETVKPAPHSSSTGKRCKQQRPKTPIASENLYATWNSPGVPRRECESCKWWISSNRSFAPQRSFQLALLCSSLLFFVVCIERA